MSYKPKKFLLCLAALSLILASLSIVIMNTSHSQAASAQLVMSATDYYVPGSDPWGTAFDSSGRVWVASPGCDLSPSCPSSTPPGKLSLFDPNTHSWVSLVSLPAGYGQPTFVAVDHNGNVWFTMPVTNAIGMYNPTTMAITQWSVPTASSGPWGITVDSKGIIWFTEH